MQIFGIDSSGQPVHVDHADRALFYTCPHCSGAVRVRGGQVRSRHFYHPNARECEGKSLAHQQIQAHLLQLLPGARLEERFPTLDRIADVYWQNFVFEVQCSPITAAEVEGRNEDYAHLGLTTVWILHERRFNRRRVTAAENFLADKPHHFTNIDRSGHGELFDLDRQMLNGTLLGRPQKRACTLGQTTSTLETLPPRERPFFKRVYLGLFHFFLEGLIVNQQR